MRLLLVGAVALLIAAASCAASAESDVAIRNNNRSVDDVRKGLDAMQKFIDIFNSDIFDKTPVGQVAEILSKSLSFVISIIDLISGNQSEDPTIKFLREKFDQVNNKLDQISLQIGDVKKLIKWTSTRQMYAQYERRILTASGKFNAYLTASESQKAARRQEFIMYFEANNMMYSALEMYRGVVEKKFTVADNLAAAAKEYTNNHRKKVLSWLLALNRIILRGSQLEIAYRRMKKVNAGLAANDWKERMKKYVNRMKEVETMTKNEWNAQMKTDVKAFLTNNKALSNQQFSRKMYEFLAEKYDWQYWIVVSYKPIAGSDKHYMMTRGGVLHFREAGRNLAVGRADKKGRRFSKSMADAVLSRINAENTLISSAQLINERIRQYSVGVNENFVGVVGVGFDCYCTAARVGLSTATLTGVFGARVYAYIFG